MARGIIAGGVLVLVAAAGPAQAELIDSLEVYNPLDPPGLHFAPLTHQSMSCGRTSGTDDTCSDSVSTSFKSNHYRISWCTSGTCSGYNGGTDGTIDLHLEGSLQWCVRTTMGAATAACNAGWISSADDLDGGALEPAHELDGWFSVMARRS